MKETLQNIKIWLWNNILEYCYCWSWEKYNECCKNKESDFINIFTDFISTINEKNKSPKNRTFYAYLWEKMTNNICIIPWCCNNNINSHLYPKSYLKKNWENFAISFFNKTIHANNITTPLFCKKHDNDLFKISDNIDNFHDLLKNQIALENYFKKILFFKYKTFLIQIRYLLWKIYYWCEESKKIFYEIYPLYNQICVLIDDMNKWKRIIYLFFPSMNYTFKNPYNTIFSNICFTPSSNIPFWIISTKDNWWYSMWICVYWNINNNASINILNKIKEIRKKQTNKNNLEICEEIYYFLHNHFNLNIYYNRELFLYNDFIDIWIMNFNFEK